MRAEIRFHKAEEDLQTKDLQIADHRKKEKEMETKWVLLLTFCFVLCIALNKFEISW